MAYLLVIKLSEYVNLPEEAIHRLFKLSTSDKLSWTYTDETYYNFYFYNKEDRTEFMMKYM